jgi:hypothetical protein
MLYGTDVRWLTEQGESKGEQYGDGKVEADADRFVCMQRSLALYVTKESTSATSMAYEYFASRRHT